MSIGYIASGGIGNRVAAISSCIYDSQYKNINLKVSTNKFKTEITFKKNKNSFQELLKAVLIVKGIQ